MFALMARINWDKVDMVFASFARPYAVYVGSTTLAIACMNKDTAGVAIPSMAALLTAFGAARTVEKVKLNNNTTITTEQGDDK